MFKATLCFSPNSCPFATPCPMCGPMHLPGAPCEGPHSSQSLPRPRVSLTHNHASHQTSRCTPSVENWYLFFFEESVLLARSAENSFTEHVLDIQLTRYVSYVPNGFSQVKVLQARANAIFSQDKVTVLLETVRSTIKPIDQPLELVLQRDTEIETKIAWPFSL